MLYIVENNIKENLVIFREIKQRGRNQGFLNSIDAEHAIECLNIIYQESVMRIDLGNRMIKHGLDMNIKGKELYIRGQKLIQIGQNFQKIGMNIEKVNSLTTNGEKYIIQGNQLITDSKEYCKRGYILKMNAKQTIFSVQINQLEIDDLNQAEVNILEQDLEKDLEKDLEILVVQKAEISVVSPIKKVDNVINSSKLSNKRFYYEEVQSSSKSFRFE